MRKILLVLWILFSCSQVFAAGNIIDRSATSAEVTAQVRNDIWLSPASIPLILANPGTISKFNLATNVELLNADRTILTTDKPIQWFDANGASRNIILPAETSSTNLIFIIYNDSNGAGENLIIQNDTPTTLVTIGPGQGVRVACDGVNWRVLNNNGIYYDAVSGNRGVGINTPTSKLHLAAGTSISPPLKFTTGTLLTTPEKGACEFNNGRFYITGDGVQRTIDRTGTPRITTVTVENTTVETTVFEENVPANSVYAGSVIKFYAFGNASNESTSDDLTIRLKVAGQTLVTINNSARNFSEDDVHLRSISTQRTIGTNGTRVDHFDLNIGGDNAFKEETNTIDTTSNMDVVITAQWNNAKTGNTFSLYQAFMEFKN